jgi:hypothetical protein
VIKQGIKDSKKFNAFHRRKARIAKGPVLTGYAMPMPSLGCFGYLSVFAGNINRTSLHRSAHAT